MDNTDLEKKLLYRCLHRGCKETDFLLGRFGEDEIKEMDLDTQKIFDELLNEDDMLIYDWFLAKQKNPEKYDVLLKEVQIFHKL